MKPNLLLAESVTPDGEKITLHERDGRFAIRVAGRELMNSAVPSSELLLGELGLAGVRAPKKILIGGLGLGFTLKRVLELAAPDAAITVLELMPAVVEWNRTHLAKLNGDCLADPRVTVKTDNVRTFIACSSPEAYDAVLLDVDNGPAAMVSEDNKKLYSERGLARIMNVLPRGGRMVVWSAGIDIRFTARMERAGFITQTVRAKTHKGAHSSAYAIFIGDKSPAQGGVVAGDAPKAASMTRNPNAVESHPRAVSKKAQGVVPKQVYRPGQKRRNAES